MQGRNRNTDVEMDLQTQLGREGLGRPGSGGTDLDARVCAEAVFPAEEKLQLCTL